VVDRRQKLVSVSHKKLPEHAIPKDTLSLFVVWQMIPPVLFEET
jgi:hypothetical protein